jgi:hypothetical protein
MEIPEFYGCRGEETEETDYQLVAGVFDLPRPRHTFDDFLIQYHQPEISGISCTLHAALTSISALTGYRFTIEQRRFLWDEAMKDPGYLPGKGWYINRAVALVRRFASLWLKEEFVYYRFELGSEEHMSIADKGYLFVTGYSGNIEYGKDYIDGRLDLIKLAQPVSYAHSLSNGDEPNDSVDHRIIDNYFKITDGVNIYKIAKENIKKLVEVKIFFKDAYVFAYKGDVDNPPSLVSSFAVNSVEKAKKWGILDWSNPQQPVDSVLLEDILKKLKLLTIDTDKGCSKERLIVALDRSGILDKPII